MKNIYIKYPDMKLMKMRRKRIVTCVLITTLILSTVFTMLPYNCKAGEVYPTLSIKIHKIQKLEGGDEGGDVDFRYFVSVYNAKEGKWENRTHTCPGNNPSPIMDTTDTFQVYSKTVYIAIRLIDIDTWSGDDSFDISSKKGGGISDSPYANGAIYTGYFDLATDSLTGDKTEQSYGYYVTSGEYDGSIDVDENDAIVYFKVWDNYEPPVAEAGPNQWVKVNDLVNFDGTNSYTHSSSITKYQWDFNNDGIYDAEGEVASHRYTDKGTYTVTLKITDNIGVEDTDTCTIYVDTSPPVADFAYNPEKPKTSTEIHFIDKSYDTDGTIISWEWNFGDGATTSQQNPTHKYSKSGNYTVTLTVTDNDGATTSFSRQISVEKEEKGIPGFEMILFIGAVIAMLILKRRL